MIKILYYVILFMEGVACGTFTACINNIAYPKHDSPWYVSMGLGVVRVFTME